MYITHCTLRLTQGMGVSAVEAAVVVVLIGAFLGSATVSHRSTLRQAKELALQADLQSLRAGVMFFKARRGRYPATLEELVVQPIGTHPQGRRRLPWSLRDRGQQTVDPFGGVYRYDARAGAVASATAGYEDW